MQPKPTLFTALCWENALVILLAGTGSYVACRANQRLRQIGMNHRLQLFYNQWESLVSLLVLGLMLTFGILPRAGVLALLLLFVATTAIFGVTEFLGHLPYYGMILIIALRGTAELDFASISQQMLVLKPGLCKDLVPLAELR